MSALERWVVGQTHDCHEPFSKGKRWHRYDCSPSANARHLRRRVSNHLRRQFDQVLIAEQLEAEAQTQDEFRLEANEQWRQYMEQFDWSNHWSYDEPYEDDARRDLDEDTFNLGIDWDDYEPYGERASAY